MRSAPARLIAVLAILAVLAVSSASGLAAQTLAPAPSAVQHVVATAGSNAASASAGATAIELWVDVTPKPAIHVYAPGARDYQIVSLVMTPQRGLTFGKATYPAGTPMAFPGIAERVPVYQKMFRITQPLTLARTVSAGQTLKIAGAVNYQACDDRVCFPPASLPVKWTLEVK
jgi:thioredoxin:protein disulfide reductase